MKNITKILSLFFIVFLFSGKETVNGQSVTFNWNGTPIVVAGYDNDEKGTIQTWTVPPCVTTITIEAVGGAGGDCQLSTYEIGGVGAIVTGTVTVTPGNVLDIVAAAKGAFGDIDGGGAGGGSYVWNASTSTLLAVAGGGGGAGLNEVGPNGQTANTSAAALETATRDANNSCGVGGVGGNGGASGNITNDGAGCGGAGWLSNGGVVAAGTFYYTGYGIYPKNGTTPAYGGIADPYFSNPYEGAGGFGGGAGGGYNGGGGGGGYNGGGGGLGTGGAAGYSGGGGGSYFNGGIALSTGLSTSGADGLVTISWSATAGTATTSVTDPPCNGGTGSATVTITGGSGPPYIYEWSTAPVQTNQTATGLSVGTYTITVIDGGCSVTATATITQPAPIVIPITANNILCNGGIGSATASPTGGTSPYIYSWSTVPAQTNATATGLSVGTYTVNVADHNGCTGTASVSISQPTLLTASTSMTQATCGGNNGTATGSASGGTGPYAYSWTTAPTQTNATATGLSGGSYTVTVTDHNGCTATSSITVTNVGGITLTAGAVTYPLCNGGTGGSATYSAAGGTLPYTYSWTTAPVQTNATATGLSAGTYTITVKDANGCSITASVLITQPTVLATATTFAHASCGLPNGTATTNPSGGTIPYTYSWATVPVQTNATATGLTAGTYTVTVQDNNHCTTTASVTVTQPSAVTATISATTGVSCNGGTNGTATATCGGGTAPYTYSWAPIGGNNATGTGFSAGTYTVTVQDNNDCSVTASATISEPTPLGVTVSGPSTLCNGATGTLTATPTGGTAPYAYAWSSGLTSTTNSANINPTTSQTYTVTVTDANGCQTTGTFSVTLGSPFVVLITGDTATCSGRQATVCASVIGGSGGNLYTWTPGGFTTPCITVIPTATTTYMVSVLDNCGTTVTADVTIQVTPSPAVAFYANVNQGCAPLCIQFYNTSTVSAGTASYVWTYGNGDTADARNPIYCYSKSGDYSVSLTVVSSIGCSSTLSKLNVIDVFAPPVAAFTYSPEPATIVSPTIQFTNTSTDNAELVYSFWNFGDSYDSTSSLFNPSYTYKDTGTYCASLVVMDNHGCTDSVTNCLVVNPAYNLYIPSAFSPNSDGKNETFEPKGQYIKNFEMYIFDRWGMDLYHTTNINAGWNGTVSGGTTVAQEDTYVYKILVTDSQNKQHSYIGNVTLIK